jgi:hypothetical protein
LKRSKRPCPKHLRLHRRFPRAARRRPWHLQAEVDKVLLALDADLAARAPAVLPAVAADRNRPLQTWPIRN